ncbi:MAG: hypothetical protein U0892_09650 [Pirellulales bacterium]
MTPRPSTASRRNLLKSFRDIFTQELRNRFRSSRRRKLGLESLEDRSLLAVVTWDGGAGSLNFGDALNWSDDTAPSAVNDYVIPDLVGTPTIDIAVGDVRSLVSVEKIGVSSSLRVSATSTVFGGLDFFNGTVTVNNGAILTLQGSSTWSAGTLAGTGTLRNEGTFDIVGGGTRVINGVLENAGTMNRDGNGVLSVNSGRLRNLAGGVFQAGTSGDATIVSSGGNFDNAGTLRLLFGNATVSSLYNDNGGTIDVVSGLLKFINRTQFTNTQFAIAGGAAVESQTASQTFLSGTLSGSGAGKLRLHSLVTVNSGGATIATPAGMVEANQSFTLQGTGTLKIAGGSDYRLANPVISTVSAPIEVNGELFLDGSTALQVSSIVLINPSGKLRLRNSSTGTSGGQVQNYGEVINDTGTNTFTPIVNNLGGTIRAISGSLKLQNTGTATLDGGSFVAGAGAQIAFRGPRTWKGSVSGSGEGHVFLGETGTQTIDASGVVFNFPNGFANLVGSGTSVVNGAGEILVAAGSYLDLGPVGVTSGVTLNVGLRVAGTLRRTDTGSVQVNGGEILIEPAGVLRNEMPAAATGTQNVFRFLFTSGILTNAGTLIQDVPGVFAIGLPLVNTGTVSVRQGNLSFSAVSGAAPASLMTGGTLDVAAGATLAIPGSRTWKGEIRGTGTGTLSITGAALDAAGASFDFDVGLNATITGVISGGTLTVAAGRQLSLGATTLATTLDDFGLLKLNGLLTVSTGQLNIQPGGVTQVRSNFQLTKDLIIPVGGTLDVISGNVTSSTGKGIVNRGSIRKSAVSATAALINTAISFEAGTIDVDAGTLSIAPLNGVFNDPVFNVATGATLEISSTQTWKGRATGSGGGTINKQSQLLVDSAGLALDFPEGLFNFYNTLNIGGTGVITIPVGSSVGSASLGTKTFTTGLEVFGTIKLNSSSWLVNNPAYVHLHPGSLLEGYGSINANSTPGPGYLINEGTIHALGTGTSSGFSINLPVDSPGTVDIQNVGTFSISNVNFVQHLSGTLSGGTWIVRDNSTLSLPIVSNPQNPGSALPVASIGVGTTVELWGNAKLPLMEAAQLQSNAGTLAIRNGKSFTTFRQFTNSGTITVDNSIFNTTTTLTNTVAAYSQSSGATILKNSTLITPTFTINGGSLQGTGGITGNVVNSAGIVAPGASPGKITITGNYTQGAAASLDIEVAGTNAANPDFDQLIVTGSASLNGTLNASVINEFLPSKGETFRFLTAGSVVGDFHTKHLADYQEYPLFGSEKGSNYYDLTSRNIIVRNTNDSGTDSLRQAILTANLNSDADAILLHIPGSGPHTISPLSNLPAITQPVTIDAYAQRDAVRNTITTGSNAVLKVELDGTQVIGGQGLRVQSDDVTITGIAFTHWLTTGLAIEHPAAAGTQIVGNYLGLKPDATPAGNANGVLIRGGANSVTIGGTTAASRNIISGNTNAGVLIESSGTSHSTIIGNWIGTDPQGLTSIGNSAGVMIDAGASQNTLGGSTPEARNIISGNLSRDVWITGSGSTGNSVIGNFIGLDVTGTHTIGASISFGVLIDDHADGNFIGSPTTSTGTGGGNVIAGHVENIRLEADAVQVQGNLIGTNALGSAALGGDNGITIAASGLLGNQIGGSTPTERNVISGHSSAGIRIENVTSMHNRIEGNSIGSDRTGDAAVPNNIGIEIIGFASDNTIGGSTAGRGNVIAGNTSIGIELNSSSHNSILGNSIGLLSSGTPLSNGTGVTIINASLNTIGSDSWTGRNTISGNAQAGIHITGAGALGNLVQSNAIGTDATGTIARPNAVGVLVDGGAHDNQIGTNTAQRNVISGNTTAGIRLAGSATTTNIIAGNTIGLGLNGETIGNGYGVIDDGTGTGNPLQSNRLGGNLATERNTISANLSAGVRTVGSDAGLRVEGNIIGLDINGTVDRGNQGSGVIVDSANTTIIHNTVSGNASDGIVVTGNAAQITGNRIGLDHSGAFAIGNDAHGIVIDALASLTAIDDNTIAGNAAGIRDAGSQSSITDNRIGTNLSGLKMIGNRRGSGTATDGHLGILEIGSLAQIGDVSSGNVIVGHDIGIRLRDAGQAIVINNHIGTDALEVAAMPNTIGMELSGTSSGNVIQSNGISNSLTSGLHLLGGTSNHNLFLANRYVGNLGTALDAGTDGATTLNDAGDSDGLLNFPVLEYADILNDALVVRGFVGSGRSVELYESTPTVNGIGQGATSLGVFTEGTPSDSDLGSGNYGPDMRGVPVGTASGNRFEFTIPLSTLPPALRYGSLVTAIALGSTSEFGNAVPIGDPATALAPKVFLPLGVSLVQGESLRVQGSFRDDDSTAWTLSVDYGDGTGPQPLAFASDHTFLLEHTYQIVSGVPYQVTVTAFDNSNRVGVGVMGVSVGNDPPQPTFNSFEFTPVISEGQAITLKGAFSDSGANDSHTISIDWGDGSSPTIIPLPVGAREFTSLHQYPDDGASGSASEFYRIRITMSDNLGGFSSTPDGLYIVEVKNELPMAPALTAPNSLIENQLFGLSGSFDDVGLLDTHTVSIDWGDGSPRETLGTSQLLSNPATRVFSVLHRFLDEPGDGKAGYNVTVEVTDDDQPLCLCA